MEGKPADAGNAIAAAYGKAGRSLKPEDCRLLVPKLLHRQCGETPKAAGYTGRVGLGEAAFPIPTEPLEHAGWSWKAHPVT